MSKWAVMVVHGVGDTGPGVTVDGFLGALRGARPNLKPDGKVEVHMLRDDPPPRPRSRPPDDAVTRLFPVHVRRARIESAPAGGPGQAVFAEVYWADLSTIREGTVHLLLGLVATIFSLRYIADQAAVMPEVPPGVRETTPESVARWSARLLRFLLRITAFLLCGPVAAVSALTACVLAADYLVLHYLKAESSATTETGLLVLGAVATVIAGVACWRCVCEYSGTTWMRFWFWFGVASALMTEFVIWRLDTAVWSLRWGQVIGAVIAAFAWLACWYFVWKGSSNPRKGLPFWLGVGAALAVCLGIWSGRWHPDWVKLTDWLQRFLDISQLDRRAIAWYASLLLVILQALFAALGAVLLIALLPLGVAVACAPRGLGLRLMPCVRAVDDIPKAGKNLIVVADVQGVSTSLPGPRDSGQEHGRARPAVRLQRHLRLGRDPLPSPDRAFPAGHALRSDESGTLPTPA
jgi:hypothetical protein